MVYQILLANRIRAFIKGCLVWLSHLQLKQINWPSAWNLLNLYFFFFFYRYQIMCNFFNYFFCLKFVEENVGMLFWSMIYV